ncbi:MAG TPA: hypothetical protein VL025_17605 [Thermoanaerobaculia bacterium]|nr:hypothetical protein [Thermoanaerobaculia bacterium]
MTQIAFLTLFLGLTLGPQPMELTVTGPVAVVEILLDGAPVARFEEPPWSGRIDFGPALLPHELVARALDDQGTEISRVRQWVNLPRAPAEVEILFEQAPGGRRVAGQLIWRSRTGENPSAMAVTFDGEPLIPDAQGRIVLPPHDPETVHVLSAELRFSGSLVARKDVAFGGELGDEVSTELTAVPVRLRKGQRLPPPEQMRGWFLSGGRPLPVAAVEEGPAELFVVRDLTAWEELRNLETEGKSRSVLSEVQRNPQYRRFLLMLGKEDTVRFVWPVARSVTSAGLPAELFDMSRDLGSGDGGLLWFLSHLLPRVDNPGKQRLTDAVAVGGLQALYGNRRRAVLLVLGERPVDVSRSDPALVRRYLESIRVPFFVWTLGDPAVSGAAWGGGTEVSSLVKMRKAFARLEKDLEAQRIVWLNGRHLPQSIELSPAVAAVLAPVPEPVEGRP